MGKCIIHIGMHKTGTTSIQQSLNNYEDDRFLYARLAGSSNHSVPIYSLFSESPEKHFLNRKRAARGTLNEYVLSAGDDLESSIALAGDRTLILSGEDIAILSEAAVKRLSRFFLGRFSSVQILAYIRPPMSFMNSAFQQIVRSGRQTQLDLERLYRSYRGSFEKFDRFFGKENVLLKLFDRNTLAGGDSVVDFCTTIGLNMNSVKVRRANESSSKEFITLVFQYNRYCEKMGFERLSGGETERLSSVLKNLGSSKFKFSPELLRGIIEKNAEDLRWIEERLGVVVDDSKMATCEAADVRSEDELLIPVSGAHEFLLDLALTRGLDRETTVNLTDNELFHRLREELSRLEFGVVTAGNRLAAKSGYKKDNGKQDAGGSARRILVAQRNDIAKERTPAVLKPTVATVRKGTPLKSFLRERPRPLLNVDNRILVYWSPKSACTTVYVWFANSSGFFDELIEFGRRVHKHRGLVYYRSDLYRRSAESDLKAMRRLKVIRCPYSRAVSIYHHALKTGFADPELRSAKGTQFGSGGGFSFQEFLDYVEMRGVWSCNIHIQPQFRERELELPPTRVINISNVNLFDALNDFESDAGLTKTDFNQMSWLHDLEGTRRARTRTITGDDLDERAFSRAQVREGYFPSYEQLLTPRARSRIESIYKVDFDAYAKFL